MRPSTTTLLIVLVGGLLLASAHPIAAADSDTKNGIPANETDIYFSEDPDNYTSDTDYYNLTGSNRTAIAALANGTDIYFKQPPDQVETWNSNDFADLQSEFSTDTDTSVHPEGATTKDGSRFIDDAHISLYSITPSTELHRTNGESKYHIGRSGTVRALVDYRIDHPLDDVDPGDGKLVEWELLDASIEKTYLIEGTQIPDDGYRGSTLGSENADTHTPEFDYTIRGNGKKDTSLTVVAEIDVEFLKVTELEKTKTEQVCEQVTTENGTYLECTEEETTYWDEVTETLDESVVVSQTLDPVNTRRSQQMVQEIIHPSGQRDYAITIEGRPWGQVNTGDNVSVTSRWRYFSRGGAEWATIISETDSGTDKIDLGAIPLQTHGFPHQNNDIGGQTSIGEPEIKSLSETNISSPPEFSDTINLPVANESYTYSHKFAILDPGSAPDIQTKTVVNGDEAISVEGPTTRIRETNLDFKILEKNASHVLVQAHLTENETGSPISLQNRNGNITVQGQNKKTNSSGYATLIVGQDSLITAEYDATPWYETDNPTVYESSSARVTPANEDLYYNSAGYLFKLGMQGIPIILLTTYLVDHIPMVDIWPPWRKFP